MTKPLAILVAFFCLWSFCGVASTCRAESLGIVTGQLQAPEGVECRGMVSLWPVDGPPMDDPSLYNLVPYWVEELRTDCSFEMTAAPGRYYMRGIIRMTSGWAMGPLRIGDLVFSFRDEDGRILQVDVNPESPADVGTQNSYSAFVGFVPEVKTGLTGRLLDFKERPVQGMRVLAYADREMIDFVAVSEPSDESGGFALRLAEPAKLYLQAREQLGPLEGNDLFGIYGGKKMKDLKAVTVKQGERIEGLEIFVAPHE